MIEAQGCIIRNACSHAFHSKNPSGCSQQMMCVEIGGLYAIPALESLKTPPWPNLAP
jgi:hypothetical protein